jgi:hypothetical protein
MITHIPTHIAKATFIGYINKLNISINLKVKGNYFPNVMHAIINSA